ncbi:MAG: hypothetical protein SPK28_06725 [Bacilli bacterium]|nr:hypothetical protein [Bacilli bacterium]
MEKGGRLLILMQRLSILALTAKIEFSFLCESFCRAPALAAKHQDLRHFVENAVGIVPVQRQNSMMRLPRGGVGA